MLTLYAKAYCLTANGYPSVDGFTHRTYIMEIEDAEDSSSIKRKKSGRYE